MHIYSLQGDIIEPILNLMAHKYSSNNWEKMIPSKLSEDDRYLNEQNLKIKTSSWNYSNIQKFHNTSLTK